MEKMNQKESNAFFMYIVSLIMLFNVGIKTLQTFLEVVPKGYTSRMVELIGALLIFIFMKFTPLRLRPTGLVAPAEKVKKTIIRCGLICLGILTIMVLTRIVLQRTNGEMANRPWFGLYLNVSMRWLYPVTVVVQEFFAKGFIQENMKRFLRRQNPFLAIVASSMLFVTLHLGYPLYYMICAGILCFVTGYIYEKDRSIWGCAMIHFCIGFLPRAIGLK